MSGKKMEGNEEQRRAAAREAREEGKAPSEVGATLGASQQRKEAHSGDSHEERLSLKSEGKQDSARTGDEPRPRSRD